MLLLITPEFYSPVSNLEIIQPFLAKGKKFKKAQMKGGWQVLFAIGSPLLDTTIVNYIIHIFFQNASRGVLLEPWLLQKDKYGTIDSAI